MHEANLVQHIRVLAWRLGAGAALFAAGLVAIGGPSASPAQIKGAKPIATLILTNARIWTAEPEKKWASAMAIKDNRILSVGGEKQALSFADERTKKLDLGGRFVMPGINDAHIHFGGGALNLTRLDLNEALTLDAIQKALAKYAAENSDAKWLLGSGWQYTSLPGGRLPTRQDLDAVVRDRPVYLTAYDGHSGWANSKALEMAGVTGKEKFSGYGEVVLDAEGRPSGMLKEGAQSLVRRHVPPVTPEERMAALRRGLKLAASLGITSIQNQGGSRSDVEQYAELLKTGELTLRVSQAISVGPQAAREDLERVAAMKKEFVGPMLRVSGIKMMMDGVIESHTAAMLEPYSDRPDSAGSAAWTREQASRTVLLASRLELQVAIHAIGDRAVRMALDAFENALATKEASDDPRFRIEHIESVTAEDIPRFARLGVLASMQPIHADPGTNEVWIRAVGPQREKLAFAWRALEKSGARLVFSSDWPACISLNPMRGLHNAVNRQTKDGQPPGGWLPEQRVTLETALDAYTRAGAFATFEKNLKGSFAAGRLADVIVLDKDPFKIPPAEVHSIRVVLTIFDGKVIYDIR